MRRALVAFLVGSLAVGTWPYVLVAQDQPATTQSKCAKIEGVVQSTDGAVLPNMTARLRDLNTGQIVSNTTTDATGKFTFDAAPGGYVVEIVDPGGNIIATSPSIKVTPDCKDVPPLTLIAKGAGGMFWTSKAGVLALVFAGAGVTAGIIAATREPTSPSR